MRLKINVAREMHWHKEAEWSHVLQGRVRITAIDQDGHTFIADVGAGDLRYFPGGIPHSIQRLASDVDGVEFLLVFDDGAFSEDPTFLITDWLAHTPKDVLAKNLGVSEDALSHLPGKERYIFPMPHRFAHRMTAQEPQRLPGGTIRVTDTRNFPASKRIAAALIELEPGGLRELHWHPQGDVGYVPFAMGRCIENTGPGRLRYLEAFRSDRYADLSLNQWIKPTPPRLVRSHLDIGQSVLDGLSAEKHTVLPGKSRPA